jgi:hypothetical protein
VHSVPPDTLEIALIREFLLNFSDADYAKVDMTASDPFSEQISHVLVGLSQAPELPFPNCWYDVADVIRWT